MNDPLEPIQVIGSDSSYPIIVTANNLQSKLLTEQLHANQVLVVTSRNLEAIATPIVDYLKATNLYPSIHTHTVDDGDQYKTLESADTIWRVLLEKAYLRDCLLIAIGGGVIGDLVGFAAACYMRGVKWLNIPTTLLAQVDAAIGGKTGVNHPLAKNMIGAFHAPSAVLSDVALLETLPEHEYLSGLAEVIKYGIALDKTFFQWLNKHIDLILRRESVVLLTMVHKCSQIKAKVVTDDFKEEGIRALLNFGHTTGHAIETCMNYKISHGFAVSIGMAVALKCSLSVGLDKVEYAEAIELLRKFGLPTKMPDNLEAKTIMSCMARDKKNLSDMPLRMILVPAIGKSQCISQTAPEEVLDALRYFGAT